MKFFSLKDLLRIVKATFADPITTLPELRDFMYILLYTCSAAGRHVRLMREELNADRGEMSATYAVLQEAIKDLGAIASVFPQFEREQIMKFIFEEMGGELGYVKEASGG